MTDDLLARATRALREETRDQDEGAHFTRSRIMASVHEERVRHRTRLAFLIPIAATFLAASAWGAANGKLGRAVAVFSEAIGLSPAQAPSPAAKVLPRASPVHSAPANVEPAPPAPPPEAPEPPPAESEAPVMPGPESVEGPKTAASAAAPKASASAGRVSDPAFDLYRAAHQAHFVDRDPGRALPAWEAYLRAAPNASLSLEARYNRALCLVRLHRSGEARAALRPFAEGRYGGYRQAEARELIAALPSDLAGPGDSGL
ncbi:MAG TPA: hypothetical protein VGK73_13870 [Polyangiaceae bacterium]